MAGGWFGKRPAADRSVVERIRFWAAAAYADQPETRFSINEIICRDPSCPGAETIILVMTPVMRTVALKIAGSMAEVCEQDVIDAVMTAAKAG